MNFRIATEDPAGADVVQLLEDGEAYAAALYPAESNHFLSIESLRAPNVHFLVARDEAGQALATGAVAINDGWAELKRMWVVPAARGRGISKAMLADLERRAKDGGAEWLRLETGIANHEALALYERSGWPFADYLPDPLSVFMEKRLGGDGRRDGDGRGWLTLPLVGRVGEHAEPACIAATTVWTASTDRAAIPMRARLARRGGGIHEASLCDQPPPRVTIPLVPIGIAPRPSPQGGG